MHIRDDFLSVLLAIIGPRALLQTFATLWFF